MHICQNYKLLSAPMGIRTPALRFRGGCPNPLDDRGLMRLRRDHLPGTQSKRKVATEPRGCRARLDSDCRHHVTEVRLPSDGGSELQFVGPSCKGKESILIRGREENQVVRLLVPPRGDLGVLACEFEGGMRGLRGLVAGTQ